MIEPIEQANLRLIHALGVDAHGRPRVADVACKERARVMRLAGTVNYKTGQYARVVEADFALPAYALAELVGALPDPSPPAGPSRRSGAWAPARTPTSRSRRPSTSERLAGITVPRGGLVSCPAPAHRDRHPSCSVGAEAVPGLVLPCRGLRGARRDLRPRLSARGGPWGRELRGTAFTRARARVREVFGDVG